MKISMNQPNVPQVRLRERRKTCGLAFYCDKKRYFRKGGITPVRITNKKEFFFDEKNLVYGNRSRTTAVIAQQAERMFRKHQILVQAQMTAQNSC